MSKKLCENCIKNKTMSCPNTNECMTTKDKPFYIEKGQELQEIERLNKEYDRLYIEDTKRLNEKDQEIERLNNIINELEKYLEEERDRLAEGTSHTYEDSLGKTRLVNEDIFDEITIIKDKLQELKEKE